MTIRTVKGTVHVLGRLIGLVLFDLYINYNLYLIGYLRISYLLYVHCLG